MDMLSLWLELRSRTPHHCTALGPAQVRLPLFATLGRLGCGCESATTVPPRRMSFTRSTLLDCSRRPTTRLVAGSSHYIRLTVIDPRLARLLVRHLPVGSPARLPVGDSPTRPSPGDSPLDLLSATLDAAAPGGGSATYQQLLDLPPPRRLIVAFDSPTVLRRHRQSLPLPDPAGLFNDYLRKWNAFSPLPLPAGMVNEAVDRGHLLLTWHQVRSAVWRAGRTPRIGFMGVVQFDLKPGPSARPLAAVARFAPYCGSGCHTTHGMGQTWFGTDGDRVERM